MLPSALGLALPQSNCRQCSDTVVAYAQTRQPKIEGFFGPGVTAVIVPGSDDKLDVLLISDGTAAAGVAEDEARILSHPLEPASI